MLRRARFFGVASAAFGMARPELELAPVGPELSGGSKATGASVEMKPVLASNCASTLSRSCCTGLQFVNVGS